VATASYRLIDDIVRYRWLCLGLVVAAATWCLVDVMPRGGIYIRRPFQHRTDFTVYTEAGAAFFDGRDPYQVSNPRGWRYLYPPLFAIVVSPLHALPSTGQVSIWFAISCAFVVGCYAETRRLFTLLVDKPARAQTENSNRLWLWIGIAGIAVAMLPILNCLQRGQVEVLKLYLLLLGFRMVVSGRSLRDWSAAGIVLALPVVLKVTPLLPVACLIIYECGRAWFERPNSLGWKRATSLSVGVGAGVLLFAFFIPAAVLGWSANVRHLETWFAGVVTKAVDVRTSDFGEDVRSPRNQSLDNAAYRFGNWLIGHTIGGPDDSLIDRPHPATQKLPMDDATAGQLIVAGRVIALATLLLFVLRAARSGDPIGRAATFGLACVATLVVCPVARGCYFALFLPAVVFSTTWLAQLGRADLVRAFAFLPAALVWTYYLASPLSGRLGLLGIGTTAWFFTACVLLDRSLARSRTLSVDRVRAPTAASNEPESPFAAAA